LESLRPDVVVKREAFVRKVRRIPSDKLVFLDEAAMHLSMSRSHAWVRRGEKFIERLPVNWGKYNLTLLGAMRLSGWVVLNSIWGSTNKEHFATWFRTKLLSKLRRGDVVVMDNLSAHHGKRVAEAAVAAGVRLLYLPPYSPDFNPIESGWALQKQHVRRFAPREEQALRRLALRARYRVTQRHCAGWFRNSGYRVNSGDRWG
jgi:transposase